MEKQGVSFCERHNDDGGTKHDAFKFTVVGSADDYLSTLEALLSLLGGIPDEFCSQGERYFVCELIKDMLPNYEQIKMIMDSQMNNLNQK